MCHRVPGVKHIVPCCYPSVMGQPSLVTEHGSYNCSCPCHLYPMVQHCHCSCNQKLSQQKALDELVEQAQELNLGYGDSANGKPIC